MTDRALASHSSVHLPFLSARIETKLSRVSFFLMLIMICKGPNRWRRPPTEKSRVLEKGLASACYHKSIRRELDRVRQSNSKEPYSFHVLLFSFTLLLSSTIVNTTSSERGKRVFRFSLMFSQQPTGYILGAYSAFWILTSC